MNFIEHRLIRGFSSTFAIDYLRVNEWRWTGRGINQLVIPEDGKILIEITGTGKLRVFRSSSDKGKQ